MNPQSQVTSLELSKRLKELGVKQDSYFWWNTITLELLPKQEMIRLSESGLTNEAYWRGNFISAYTVAELGEMLPPLYESYLCAGIHEWHVNLNMNARDKHTQYPTMRADTEAEARGRMLEYLIKNNLLSV